MHVNPAESFCIVLHFLHFTVPLGSLPLVYHKKANWKILGEHLQRKATISFMTHYQTGNAKRDRNVAYVLSFFHFYLLFTAKYSFPLTPQFTASALILLSQLHFSVSHAESPSLPHTPPPPDPQYP